MADEEILTEVDDISADIRAAVEQSSNRALAEKVVTAEVEIPAETEQQKADRLRDEGGRFVAMPVEQAKAAPEQITDADPAQAKVEASPAISMPKTWSADAKAEWSNLSPAVQQAVLKREQEMDSGGRQWSEQRATYEQALAPLSDFAQRYQIDPPQALNRLLEWQGALETDPANAIIQLARVSGVDLVALVNGSPQPQAQQQQFNPDLIYNGVNQLIAQQFQKRDEDQAVNSQIQSFASERDAAGQLKHPHFDNKAVKERMGALLEKGLAADLDDAYQQSIWAMSDIRSSLMAPKAEVQQRQQVNKSKAAKMPSGAPGGSTAKANGFAPDQSLDDDLREAIAMHRH